MPGKPMRPAMPPANSKGGTFKAHLRKKTVGKKKLPTAGMLRQSREKRSQG